MCHEKRDNKRKRKQEQMNGDSTVSSTNCVIDAYGYGVSGPQGGELQLLQVVPEHWELSNVREGSLGNTDCEESRLRLSRVRHLRRKHETDAPTCEVEAPARSARPPDGRRHNNISHRLGAGLGKRGAMQIHLACYATFYCCRQMGSHPWGAEHDGVFRWTVTSASSGHDDTFKRGAIWVFPLTRDLHPKKRTDRTGQLHWVSVCGGNRMLGHPLTVLDLEDTLAGMYPFLHRPFRRLEAETHRQKNSACFVLFSCQKNQSVILFRNRVPRGGGGVGDQRGLGRAGLVA